MIWISLYAILQLFIYFLVDHIRLEWLVAAESMYWAALLLHLRKKKLLIEYGMCLPVFCELYSAVILLAIPAINCVSYGVQTALAEEMILILLTSLAEEMAFRVLLPKLLSEKMHCSVKKSIIISSIAFGLFHGVNLLSGAAGPDVLIQMLYAFCAGLTFCAMVQKTKSVLPSVILHALINWTAGSQIVGAAIILQTLAFSALFAGYAIIIFHNTQKGSTYL